eukprot:scaffold179944_cov24-Prasinocladus_malaysianus.AAC.1
MKFCVTQCIAIGFRCTVLCMSIAQQFIAKHGYTMTCKTITGLSSYMMKTERSGYEADISNLFFMKCIGCNYLHKPEVGRNRDSCGQ